MSASEFFDFIFPQNELLQLSFLVLIVSMMMLTIITTHKYANAAHWEKKWNGNTPDDHQDDLDIDHGSVTDIWNAVATAPEKLAEVMPGMLLVVGLLGTFLGLGLALNHASHILGQADALSTAGAASSMQDLMGLLQGLGTKFKTSTWGIMGFLLLKVWSSLTRFEEKRLSWVIRKVKTELEHRKIIDLGAATAKQQALFAQIEYAASLIGEGFTKQMVDLKKQNEILHKHGVHYFEKNIQAVQSDLTGINVATQASSEAMNAFVGSTKEIIQDMATASQTMADGAHQVGEAGQNLVSAVDAFSVKFTQVLNDVRTDLGMAINNMSEQAAHTLEQGSKELGSATLEISKALGVLSKDVTITMNDVKNSIGNSLKIQQDGAILFRRSSDTLNENVTATTGLVEKLGDDIRSGLEAVSASGRRMAGIGKSLEVIVPEMRDLPPALRPLEGLPALNRDLLNEIKFIRDDLCKLKDDSKFEKHFSMVVHVLNKVVTQLDQLCILQRDHQFIREKSDISDEQPTTGIQGVLK